MYVYIQIITLCKCCSTACALVRLFTRVCSLVYTQITDRQKRLATPIHVTCNSFFTSVFSLVAIQISALRKRFITPVRIACKWLFTSVCSRMANQPTSSRKRFITPVRVAYVPAFHDMRYFYCHGLFDLFLLKESPVYM
jgi:hypothetical protein